MSVISLLLRDGALKASKKLLRALHLSHCVLLCVTSAVFLLSAGPGVAISHPHKGPLE